MVQKMAMQIPRRKEGSHLTSSFWLSKGVDSVTIMKRYVSV
jgi:hypothetical protein